LVESLFMKFGLYEHHWWEYYMTAGAVLLYLVIAKIWNLYSTAVLYAISIMACILIEKYALPAPRNRKSG
jgi:hypothetical protein